MMLPPDTEDGLGVVILNSNAETHFSFTNALGFIPMDQARRLRDLIRHYPAASWIVALHHHLVEYPDAGEGILGAHRNGARQRQLVRAQTGADRQARRRDARPSPYRLDRRLRAVADHFRALAGHGTRRRSTHFYIHTLTAGPDGQLGLLPPQRVEIAGEKKA